MSRLLISILTSVLGKRSEPDDKRSSSIGSLGGGGGSEKYLLSHDIALLQHSEENRRRVADGDGRLPRVAQALNLGNGGTRAGTHKEGQRLNMMYVKG